MNAKTFTLTVGAVLLLAGSVKGADDPPSSTTPAVGSGIVSHQGAAYIVHQLEGAITLPNGSKIEPNGTIVGLDGVTRPMLPGQMFTLDGRIIQAPFLDLPDSSPSSSAPLESANLPAQSNSSTAK